MADINDLKLAALEALTTNTGNVQDLELEWLQTVTGETEGTINDLWMQFLEDLTFTDGSLQDRQMAYWGSLMYTGTWNDRAIQFWAAGGPSGGADSLLTDLVAWWSLDETSGTRVNAHNPGTYDLTDNNTVGYDTGVVGNAASFVGANSEFLSRNDCPLDMTQDWTIAGLFSGVSTTAGWWGTGTNQNFCTLDVLSSNRIRLGFRGDNGSNYDTSLITVTGGYATLVPIICTFNAATRTGVVTVNDDQTASVTLPEGVAPVAGTRFVVGALSTNPDSPVTGLADEVVLAQRIWTAEEQTRFAAGMAYPG